MSNNCTARALCLVCPIKGHKWGTGQKNARRANVPPMVGSDRLNVPAIDRLSP